MDTCGGVEIRKPGTGEALRRGEMVAEASEDRRRTRGRERRSGREHGQGVRGLHRSQHGQRDVVVE